MILMLGKVTEDCSIDTKGATMKEKDDFLDSGDFLKPAGIILGEEGPDGESADGFEGFDDFDDFDNSEDEEDNFLEGPLEGTPLHAVLEKNGILTVEERRPYRRYDRSNRGCSEENPILISETEDYVDLEYQVLEHLLRSPYRFVDYELEKQSLLSRDTRWLDVLTLRVYTHPIISMDRNGDIVRPEREFLGTEEYWFDITAGFDATAARHR